MSNFVGARPKQRSSLKFNKRGKASTVEQHGPSIWDMQVEVNPPHMSQNRFALLAETEAPPGNRGVDEVDPASITAKRRERGNEVNGPTTSTRCNADPTKQGGKQVHPACGGSDQIFTYQTSRLARSLVMRHMQR